MALLVVEVIRTMYTSKMKRVVPHSSNWI